MTPKRELRKLAIRCGVLRAEAAEVEDVRPRRDDDDGEESTPSRSGTGTIADAGGGGRALRGSWRVADANASCMSAWPPCSATARGVRPLTSSASASAPCSSRSLAICTLPSRTARCSAVVPSPEHAPDTSPPCRTISPSSAASFCSTATRAYGAASPPDRSAPASTSSCTTVWCLLHSASHSGTLPSGSLEFESAPFSNRSLTHCSFPLEAAIC
ncbi:Os07g0175350 [Oryza sativa Japonica Group]|uniref:Os07g0175350 protein n=1 Tax=Oryza sativa subsp. japonica TaxID=39947 RepID=A0A0P0X308_ORYSJ|nr:hypothetical protein EE612_037429 [Oryza sativa]BAT00279.1 Os07g0175350 [Oryza sativa Japonica Group]